MELLKLEDLNLQVGEKLVMIAKGAIKRKLKINVEDNVNSNEEVLQKYGMAFVTLETYLGNRYELRGCIGYVEAVAPIRDVVARAATAAAFSDPRFPPLRKDEIDGIVVEVTVLTKPEVVETQDRKLLPSSIEVGKDGLIVEKGITHSGLLLPQVPKEYCWDSETFLAETCLKAGLMPDCWLDPSVKVKKFQGVIFRETRPGGEVVMMQPADVKCRAEEEASI
ncbi:TIGR00296 family protein [Metallosphaera tengchongensis]|uniref:Protein GWK48_05995 n=1 Tax=Metallosphaera tengchongensis TaxID=1532350 RepID=A0A6N0NTG9_9CREN|nr:TIGR00296 family protein [Metallosphaera tengchongensis]QKQ99991.1 TIGR00296 family protein [Metallosphaera tengchongensis]